MLVTEKDVALAISKYLDTTTAYFDFAPYYVIRESASNKEVKEYLRSAATVLCRKKNWIITNEKGEKVKFVKTVYAKHKERDCSGNLCEQWLVTLESDKQEIHADFEYNHTTENPKLYSGLFISDKES